MKLKTIISLSFLNRTFKNKPLPIRFSILKKVKIFEIDSSILRTNNF